MVSLTGAVTSQRVTEVYKGKLELINQLLNVIVNACLTVRLTNQAETKVGYSDPVILRGKSHRSTDKRYAGDNRLIIS